MCPWAAAAVLSFFSSLCSEIDCHVKRERRILLLEIKKVTTLVCFEVQILKTNVYLYPPLKRSLSFNWMRAKYLAPFKFFYELNLIILASDCGQIFSRFLPPVSTLLKSESDAMLIWIHWPSNKLICQVSATSSTTTCNHYLHVLSKLQLKFANRKQTSQWTTTLYSNC